MDVRSNLTGCVVSCATEDAAKALIASGGYSAVEEKAEQPKKAVSRRRAAKTESK